MERVTLPLPCEAVHQPHPPPPRQAVIQRRLLHTKTGDLLHTSIHREQEAERSRSFACAEKGGQDLLAEASAVGSGGGEEKDED